MPDPSDPIDTTNKFLVGAMPGQICFVRAIPMRLSHTDALLLAAYLVALVGDDEQWTKVLDAVQNC